MPGGPLGIDDADQVVPIINQLAADRATRWWSRYQDWHHEGHPSFETWPVHCVAGTRGAELHEDFAKTSML